MQPVSFLPLNTNPEDRMPGHQAFFRPHLEALLYRWLDAAVCPNGFLWPCIDHAWQRTGPGTGSLVSQARLIYNFTKGWQLTGDERFRSAVIQGTAFLTACFRDTECGGWFTSVTAEGAPADTAKDAYGHAFALFGLSHALRVTGDPDLTGHALHTVNLFCDRFRDGSGGFIRHMTRAFRDRDTCRSQNPVMHLFEALLAFQPLDHTGRAAALAAEVLAFVRDRLADHTRGCLPELFAMNWKPLPAPEGRIDIGHQFEWAFLLSEAEKAGLDAAGTDLGRRLIDYGLAVGYDRGAGGMISSGAMTGGLRPDARKGWWEQCEAARALHRYSCRHRQTDLESFLGRTIDYIQVHLIDPVNGGWYPAPDAVKEDKGSIWKVDYHAVGMGMEIVGEGCS